VGNQWAPVGHQWGACGEPVGSQWGSSEEQWGTVENTLTSNITPNCPDMPALPTHK